MKKLIFLVFILMSLTCCSRQEKQQEYKIYDPATHTMYFNRIPVDNIIGTFLRDGFNFDKDMTDRNEDLANFSTTEIDTNGIQFYRFSFIKRINCYELDTLSGGLFFPMPYENITNRNDKSYNDWMLTKNINCRVVIQTYTNHSTYRLICQFYVDDKKQNNICLFESSQSRDVTSLFTKKRKEKNGRDVYGDDYGNNFMTSLSDDTLMICYECR